MVNWWAEEWSFGSGISRVACGISQTDEGYAVELFRGGTCVETFVYPSRAEAVQVAQGLKDQFGLSRNVSGELPPSPDSR